MESVTKCNCTPTVGESISTKSYFWFGLWLFDQISRAKDLTELSDFAVTVLTFAYKGLYVPYRDYESALYEPTFSAAYDLYQLFPPALPF